MKYDSIQNRRLSLVLCGITVTILSSCGDYSQTTPYTSNQAISRLKGYPSISGKPALHTPSAIGIFSTQRTNTLDFNLAQMELSKIAEIRSMLSIQSYASSNDYYQMSDVVAKRAKLINDVKFLDLDVLLICDQMTETEQRQSLIGAATLSLVDLNVKKQNTQLTIMCMDARTGYIYGTMGQQEDGKFAKLQIFDETVFGDPHRSHLVRTTRRDAVKQFPEFWQQIVKKYSK